MKRLALISKSKPVSALSGQTRFLDGIEKLLRLAQDPVADLVKNGGKEEKG